MDNRFPWVQFPHDCTVFTGCSPDQSKEVRRIGTEICRLVPGLNWAWNPRSRSVTFHYGSDLTVSAGSFPLFLDGVGENATQAEMDCLVKMIRMADRPKEEKEAERKMAEVSAASDRQAAKERRVSDAMPMVKDGLAFKDRARRGMKKLILPGGDL